MRKQNLLNTFIVLVFIIFIAVNINGINSFLSVNTDETVEFGHSSAVVPQSWSTSEKINMTNISKTPQAISNGYIVIEHWDDWPEDHITSISEDNFKSMENGNYKVLKNENTTMSGIAVSKQYFSNPSRDNDEVWNHVGVNYVFPKEDTNYSVQVHYFTSQDYNNSTFTKQIDELIEADLNDIQNKQYNGFVSNVWSIYDYITEHIPH